MNLGICPNCVNQLTDDSALVTEPSSIFKGSNVYLMCKNCQQILLYNRDRNMVFDLDEYKDDEDVLEEINKLLSEVDNHYEVLAPCQSNACEHNCSTCEGCDTQYKRSSNKERRTANPHPVAPVEELKEEIFNDDLIKDALECNFLAVNKADPSQKKILSEEDFKLINVQEWLFFELKYVTVNPIISYEIVRY
jgi:hypothetical protein